MRLASANECLCLVSQGLKVSKADLLLDIERHFREDLTHTQGTGPYHTTLAMAHHRHCWHRHRHSTAATGWVGTHTLAGVCRRTQDSAGTARAHLPADLPVAARPSSTLTRGTLVPLNLGRLDRAGGNLEYSAGRDAHGCTGCAIATLTLVGCTAAREQRGNTTRVPVT